MASFRRAIQALGCDNDLDLVTGRSGTGMPEESVRKGISREATKVTLDSASGALVVKEQQMQPVTQQQEGTASQKKMVGVSHRVSIQEHAGRKAGHGLGRRLS